MDEELVTLIIEGEIEVDKFVDVKVLEAGVVGDVDGWYFVDCDEGSVVVWYFGEYQVDLILEEQFIELYLYFEGLEELLFFIFGLDYLDESTIFTIDDKLLLINKIFNLFTLFLEPLATLIDLVIKSKILYCQFIVDMTSFLCFEDKYRLFQLEKHIHKRRMYQLFYNLLILTEKYLDRFLLHIDLMFQLLH